MNKKSISKSASSRDVSVFLDKLSSMPSVRASSMPARLIFAMDATASREPMWDRACHIQGRMFETASGLGGLEVQLCYYHGFELFHAGNWCATRDQLLHEMSAVRCAAGYTQIARVLRHAGTEARSRKVSAVVFVGDSMEESADELAGLAGKLGIMSVPVFVFQEGCEPSAGKCFRTIADLSGGAYCPFDANSAEQLKKLLGAVAAYAAGGRIALEDYGQRTQGQEVLRLIDQMKRG